MKHSLVKPSRPKLYCLILSRSLLLAADCRGTDLAQEETFMKVIIAGAGLGGLCLAHGLRQAGLEVQVLERRPSPADQPASYGIHLNRNGLAALRACLPAASWEQL